MWYKESFFLIIIFARLYITITKDPFFFVKSSPPPPHTFNFASNATDLFLCRYSTCITEFCWFMIQLVQWRKSSFLNRTLKMYFQELECSNINVYMSSGNNFIQCIIIKKRRLFSEVYLSMYMYVAVVFYNGIQCLKKEDNL